MSIAGALGAGLGFTALISSFKEVSTQLSTVQATLKNVSNGFGEYVENMDFLRKISKTYGQDLLALTNGFAQFRAAAKMTNLDLEQQRDIFESLTQAAGAYNLSADQTNNAMMAVTQMMSKGKVTAEELRRQLGNALPGAFLLMAKAAGIAGVTTNGTTAELEDAMKAGRIMTEDVLPAFAQVLKAATTAANFESLQNSLNRFKNSWVEFVEDSGFGDMFQKLLDKGSEALNKLGSDFNSFKARALGVLAGIGAGVGYNKLQKESAKATDNMKANLSALQAKQKEVTKSMNALADEYESLSKSTKSGGKFALHMDGVTASLMEDKRFLMEEKVIVNGIEQTVYRIANGEEKRVILEKLITEKKQEEVALQQQIDVLTEKTNKNLSAIGKLGRGLVNIGKSLVGVIKGAMGMLAFAAVLSVMTELISKVVFWAQEQKRIKNIVDDTMKSIDRVSDAAIANLSKVKSIQKVLENTNLTEKKRASYIEQLNRELGLAEGHQLTMKSTAEEINTAISNWEGNLKKAARAAAVFGKIQELTAKNLNLEDDINALHQDKNWGKTKSRSVENGYGGYDMVESYTIKALQLQQREATKLQEIEKNGEAIDRLIETIEKEGLEDPFKDDEGGGSGASGGGAAKSVENLKNAIDKYKEAVKELENQRKKGAISDKEYQDELTKTQNETWKTIAGFDDLEDKLEELGPEYKALATQLAEDFQLNQLIAGVEADIEAETKRLDKEFQELLDKEETYRNKATQIWTKAIPTRGIGDSHSDYKKTSSEILGEEAGLSEDYVKALEDFKNEILEAKKILGELDPVTQRIFDNIVEKLKDAKEEAQDLRTKASIAEWVEDVRTLQNELGKTNFDSLKDVANSFDRLAQGSKNLAQAWATLADEELDEQTEEFYNKMDALFSIVNEGVQIFETFQSILQSFNKTQEAYNAILKATEDIERIEAAQKLGYLTAEEAAELKAMATKVIAEKGKQVAVKETTRAEAANAAVGAGSAVASVPFVGPMLAVGAVAGMIALMAKAMGAFAKGGIVGGSSTLGDNNVVRANSGEMILTKGQQGTLFSMLNGKGSLGGNVEFKIRGGDLIGAIENTKMRKKG